MMLDWLGSAIGSSHEPRLARGTSQNGVRLYNERLVLSLIRRHGSLPKAEIARLTGLSAQTVSVIVRQLESEELLLKQTPQRGKVGQPLVPFTLNPDGAFALGLKVGRRSAELVLLDLTGQLRGQLHQPYGFPSPVGILDFARSGIKDLLSHLSGEQQQRIVGLGVAAPFELWNWEEAAGAPRDALESWRGFDLGAELLRLGEWPVHFSNDATAASAAELLFGKGSKYPNFAYFFVGHFLGGGLVLNGHVFAGRSGYAGSFGALPIFDAQGKSRQLIHQASLYILEERIKIAGLPLQALVTGRGDWSDYKPLLQDWLDETALGLAYGASALMTMIDFDAIIIDGAMPAPVRTSLVERTQKALRRFDLRGLPALRLEEGSIGSSARAMGAASLALFANFMTDRDLLFKEQT